MTEPDTLKVAITNDIVYAYAARMPSAVGGAERYQWHLARALAQAGCQVTVAVRSPIREGAAEVIDGVKFLGIGNGQVLNAWSRFLAQEKPDWWYWQCANHLWGPAVAIAKYRGVRAAFSAAVDRDVTIRRALFRRSRWWPLYGAGLLMSDRIFVQHEGQRDGLPRLLRGRARTLPGIVEMPPSSQPHESRPKVVAWVAQLRQVKRPDLLIEIARRLPDFRFVVCGGVTSYFSAPGYGEAMIARMREVKNIHYAGQVTPAEAVSRIAGSAALLCTSDEEGFPSTFLEAWAAGTPVVSLQIDPDALIRRYGLGALTGDVESTVRHLSRLVGSPAARESIAQKARRYVSETHTGAAVAACFTRNLRGGREPEAAFRARGVI